MRAIHGAQRLYPISSGYSNCLSGEALESSLMNGRPTPFFFLLLITKRCLSLWLCTVFCCLETRVFTQRRTSNLSLLWVSKNYNSTHVLLFPVMWALSGHDSKSRKTARSLISFLRPSPAGCFFYSSLAIQLWQWNCLSSKLRLEIFLTDNPGVGGGTQMLVS